MFCCVGGMLSGCGDRKMKVSTPVHGNQASPGICPWSSSKSKLTILSESPLALPNHAPQQFNLPQTQSLLSHSCVFSGFPLLENKKSESGHNSVSQSVPSVLLHPRFLALSHSRWFYLSGPLSASSKCCIPFCAGSLHML